MCESQLVGDTLLRLQHSTPPSDDKIMTIDVVETMTTAARPELLPAEEVAKGI